MSIFSLGRARPARVAAFGLGLTLAALVPTNNRHLAPPETQHFALAVPPPASTFAPEDREVPARLDLAPGGRELHLSGDLTEGVAVRVAALLSSHPEVQSLHLDSDGGLVEEAIDIGRLVRKRHLSTHVADACASACTLIFLQGRRRTLGPEGRLGFHAPYEIGPDGRKLAVDPAPERAAYQAAGLPRAFVERVMRVAPADIWIPDPGQLRAAGILTGLKLRLNMQARMQIAGTSSSYRSGAMTRVAEIK
ncbi:hypothetical protein [Methylobacterium sp. NFXW15]|uniref:COG3904 family protein n=1 Tax=Methylobacterium sp. NFXW15 TaxID=2819512 RepID=UPI003CEC1CE3